MIRLEDIKQVFNPRTINENIVLRGVNLRINAGDFITVIGSNGAGKTTMFNVLSGAIIPTSGKILVGDRDITKVPEHKRAKMIGRIYQNPLLGTAGNMSLEENMVLCSKKGFRGLKISLNNELRGNFAEELKTLGMGLENRLKDRVGLLSGGQRQALTLLTTVLSRPELLLLDEHTAALDPGNAEAVMTLTRRFVEEYHITAMMVTHNMQQAINYGNRLIMLDKGRIILDISGKEKSELTVSALVAKFKAIGSTMQNNDEALLEQ
ncbi:MAG: ATP-binding cassette domain-containing protein [Deferribacteraceae bacterium]|jgi:putative ABC transport system ATP-binding protein|nr:ATP-binding cassette domain-containing protein [Deferribacteraceae bacterium]